MFMSSSAAMATAAFFLLDSNKKKTASGGGGGGGPALDKAAMTYYSYENNTPCNSMANETGRPLVPYVSVAVPFRFLKKFGGSYDYGDQLHIKFLEGRKMPDGSTHTGWVQIDDFCGDNGDDNYCYQDVGNNSKLPNVDLYVGAWKSSGMSCKNGDGNGPGGNGQQVTDVKRGPAPANSFKTSYGGVAKGSGKCNDCTSACMAVTGLSASDCKPENATGVKNPKLTSKCWYYWPQNDSTAKGWCTPQNSNGA
jgi:hypothetical protein